MSYLGITAPNLFAGFTGGVVAALLTSGATPRIWSIFVAVMVGAGTGAYLGPVAPVYVGVKPSVGATFVVGLISTPLCKMLIAAYSRIRWSPLENKIEPGD